MMLLMSSVLSASRYLVDKFVRTELMDVDLIAGAQERMPFLIELLLGVRADALASWSDGGRPEYSGLAHQPAMRPSDAVGFLFRLGYLLCSALTACSHLFIYCICCARRGY